MNVAHGKTKEFHKALALAKPDLALALLTGYEIDLASVHQVKQLDPAGGPYMDPVVVNLEYCVQGLKDEKGPAAAFAAVESLLLELATQQAPLFLDHLQAPYEQQYLWQGYQARLLEFILERAPPTFPLAEWAVRVGCTPAVMESLTNTSNRFAREKVDALRPQMIAVVESDRLEAAKEATAGIATRSNSRLKRSL